jgi:hypothetical protein
MPAHVLDLYAEHRCTTNGGLALCGDCLIGALATHVLANIDFGEKQSMGRFIMDGTSWSSSDERAAILDYCQSDVDALAALLPRMAPHLDIPRALLRGLYMGAVARMERTGIPIETEAYDWLQDGWDTPRR